MAVGHHGAEDAVADNTESVFRREGMGREGRRQRIVLDSLPQSTYLS